MHELRKEKTENSLLVSKKSFFVLGTQTLFGQIAFGTGEGVTVVSGASSSRVLSRIKYFDKGAGQLGGVEKLAHSVMGNTMAVGLSSGDVLLLGP
jgi:hypothetical protein